MRLANLDIVAVRKALNPYFFKLKRYSREERTRKNIMRNSNHTH